MSTRMKRFVLIGSLLLNVFFISWAGSQLIKNRLAPNALLLRTLQTVPAEARPVFLKHLRNNQDELLQSLQQFQQGRIAASRAAQQTELDSVALEQTLKQTREGMTSAITHLQDAMLAAMQELPPEVRQDWVGQWLQQRSPQDDQLAQAIKVFSSELEK